VTSDAVKVVDAMMVAADSGSPPLRLTLGSVAYASVRSALQARLQMLEAGKAIAFSVDRTE
jgi:hypothetical protein